MYFNLRFGNTHYFLFFVERDQGNRCLTKPKTIMHENGKENYVGRQIPPTNFPTFVLKYIFKNKKNYLYITFILSYVYLFTIKF